jgi:hypothetical protein
MFVLDIGRQDSCFDQRCGRCRRIRTRLSLSCRGLSVEGGSRQDLLPKVAIEVGGAREA